MSGLSTSLRRPVFLIFRVATYVVCALLTMRAALHAETLIEGPTSRDPISLSADFAHEWDENQVHITVMRGHCRVIQGEATLQAQKMVVWQTPADAQFHRVSVYLEGDARLELPGQSLSQPSLYLDLMTHEDVTSDIRRRFAQPADIEDAVYQRGLTRKNALTRGLLQQTQLVIPGEADEGPEFGSLHVPPAPDTAMRRIRIFPRSAVSFTFHSFKSTTTTPAEQVWVLTGGVNLLIDGIEEFGTIDLAAEQMVIWTQTTADGDLTGETLQTRDAPFQVYLEGDIEIRQGNNVARMTQAFYDAREDRGLWLNAELKASLPQLQGNIRVRADRIRQLSQKSFHAQNAWTTTSEFGKPGYRVQASDIFLEHRYTTPWVGLGTPSVDPVTGAPVVEEVPWITSLNNAFIVEDVPLVFAPYLSSPADDPNIPLNGLTVEQDSVFGSQIRTSWDMFKLFGRETPADVKWNLQGDFLSKRGPAIGTNGEYRGFGMFGMPGSYAGKGAAYYIYDDGSDNLGMDRRSLNPPDRSRGRVLLRHRQDLPYSMELFGEIGYLSDRNFLEQYYETEFDRDKDYESLLGVQQQYDNRAWSIMTRGQVNEFETTTEWYPRGDLYMLGEPLLNGLLTWTSHSYAGLASLEPSANPTDPRDVFTPLPYVADVGGGIFSTRNELDMPLSLGALRIVPFIWSESSFWNDDFSGDSIQRYVGSAGVRSSLLMSKVIPDIYSRVFNLNGLAHKMVFDAEYAWTDASRGLSDIPQYNEFDDNAQERFRQRLVTNTFGGTLPTTFDPRNFAVRTGAGSSVTAPWHELVDDQQVLRMGWRHRLQTKVGPPEELRIKDWMTLDLEAAYFPNPARDNFGEKLGLLSARYRWLIGDRTSILANAYYDLFDDSQQLWNTGLVSQRSTRGSIYVGLRQIKGAALDSQIVTASYSYAMSPKWISSVGTAYDLSEERNRGQSLTITRVGESFLWHIGASFDASKDNAGIGISVEPKFGRFDASSTKLSNLLGTQ